VGWKTISGRPYYYRSIREGDRVRSQYLGPSERGGLFAIPDLEDRLEREERRDAVRAGQAEDAAATEALQEWFDRAETLANAVMIAAGYHWHHRGSWRRRRNERDDADADPEG
jgi:hypothetical protein